MGVGKGCRAATQMRVGGREVPAHLRGELIAHEGPLTTAALASTLERHGYVLLRAGHGGLPRAEVEAAADEVFGALHAVDEVEAPPNHRTATGRSERLAKHPDLNEFWQGVCQGTALRRVSHGAELQQLVSLTMGEESRPFDLMYLRPTPPGEGTPPHADFTFFATCKADTAMLNAWVPYTTIGIDEGPLLVIENTHAIPELVSPLVEIEYVDKATGGSPEDADRMTEIAYRAHGVHPAQALRRTLSPPRLRLLLLLVVLLPPPLLLFLLLLLALLSSALTLHGSTRRARRRGGPAPDRLCREARRPIAHHLLRAG